MNTEEIDLLSELREGSYEAFEEIYHSNKVHISRNLFRLLKYEELVEEILQEVFVRLWENRALIQADKPIKSYLYKIAANLANDHFRRICKDKKLADKLWEELVIHQDSFNLLSEIEADRELFRVIDLLPAQRKRVFILCKLEKKSYAEVSKMLQVSEAAINDHITRANKFIKEHYDKFYPMNIFLLALYLIDRMNKL